MLLPFTDGLMISNRGDLECARVADRHYSRRTIGSPPGSDLVLRNHDASVVFVWVWHNQRGEQLARWDAQVGYCCSLFRNESDRVASEIVIEAEQIVANTWGPRRVYTYVDPSKIQRSRQPGRCFRKAGWIVEKTTDAGLLLLAKSADRLGVWP